MLLGLNNKVCYVSFFVYDDDFRYLKDIGTSTCLIILAIIASSPCSSLCFLFPFVCLIPFIVISGISWEPNFVFHFLELPYDLHLQFNWLAKFCEILLLFVLPYPKFVLMCLFQFASIKLWLHFYHFHVWLCILCCIFFAFWQFSHVNRLLLDCSLLVAFEDILIILHKLDFWLFREHILNCVLKCWIEFL